MSTRFFSNVRDGTWAHLSYMTRTASVLATASVAILPTDARVGPADPPGCAQGGCVHFVAFQGAWQCVQGLPELGTSFVEASRSSLGVKPVKTLARCSPTIETHCGHASRIYSPGTSQGSASSWPHDRHVVLDCSCWHDEIRLRLLPVSLSPEINAGSVFQSSSHDLGERSDLIQGTDSGWTCQRRWLSVTQAEQGVDAT